MIQASTDLNPN